MDAAILELLKRALDQAAAVIAGIRPGQEALPTPCASWDVKALVEHVITQDLPHFVVSARGGMPDWTTPASAAGQDWARLFSDGAKQVLETWAAADLDMPIAVPGGGHAPLRSRAEQQIAELSVHAWDLAKATASEAELDPALAEHALDWSRRMLRPEFRGPDKAFGAEIPVPEGSSAYDRLAGWFGREPEWRPAA